MDTENILMYEREFILQSCHFNSQVTYDTYDKAKHCISLAQACDRYEEVLADIHGHNFRVIVTGQRPIETDDDGVVVWDEDLEKLVREWDRTNLSVHPDMKGKRATTEMLCIVLKEKLENRFPDVEWMVTIYETDDIHATVG